MSRRNTITRALLASAALAAALCACRAPTEPAPTQEAPALIEAAPAPDVVAPEAISRRPITAPPAELLLGAWAFDEQGTRDASNSQWLEALAPGTQGRWTFDPLAEGSGAFSESWWLSGTDAPASNPDSRWVLDAEDADDSSLRFVVRTPLVENPEMDDILTATVRFDGDDRFIVTTDAAPDVPAVWTRAPAAP